MQALVEIVRQIRRGGQDPVVRAQAEELVRDLPENNKRREAQAIYNYALEAIRYTDDPFGVDTLKPASEVVAEYEVSGRPVPADCASQTVLVGSLARALRIPVRLRVLGDETGFYHIHPELKIHGRWLSADVTAESASSPKIRSQAGLGFRAPAAVEIIREV